MLHLLCTVPMYVCKPSLWLQLLSHNQSTRMTFGFYYIRPIPIAMQRRAWVIGHSCLPGCGNPSSRNVLRILAQRMNDRMPWYCHHQDEYGNTIGRQCNHSHSLHEHTKPIIPVCHPVTHFCITFAMILYWIHCIALEAEYRQKIPRTIQRRP